MEYEVKIGSIYLGVKEGPTPEEDRKQYLEIDEFEIRHIGGPLEHRIYMAPTKWHVEEYPPEYCVDCLRQGIKNLKWHCGDKDGYRCKEHYAEKVRKELPELRCPKCEKGYLQFGTFDLFCSHCDYREPHRHSKEDRLSKNFACTCW